MAVVVWRGGGVAVWQRVVVWQRAAVVVWQWWCVAVVVCGSGVCGGGGGGGGNVVEQYVLEAGYLCYTRLGSRRGKGTQKNKKIATHDQNYYSEMKSFSLGSITLAASLLHTCTRRSPVTALRSTGFLFIFHSNERAHHITKELI